MIFIAEGKKRRGLYQDCRAVSEVYGQLLMISIVVLAFSGIALAVFSEGGAVKPKHTPHIDLQENFNRSTNTVRIFHSGGEAIDLSAIKIILNVNGNKKGEFVSPSTNPPSDSVFTLGDCIEISTKDMGINTGDDVEMFFIDMPSRQVIQKAVLQRGPWERPEWITPHPYGSVYSNSTQNGGWQPTELVAGIQDELHTYSIIPKDDWVTENYTFGIDAEEMGISNSFTSIFLKIIYEVHDNSPNTLTLCIFNGSEWTQIVPSVKYPQMPDFQTIDACVLADQTTYNITEYVNTTEKLEKLKVSFSVKGNADNSSEKNCRVDFIGIKIV